LVVSGKPRQERTSTAIVGKEVGKSAVTLRRQKPALRAIAPARIGMNISLLGHPEGDEEHEHDSLRRACATRISRFLGTSKGVKNVIMPCARGEHGDYLVVRAYHQIIPYSSRPWRA
jgi:hypothetical protein